MSWWVTDYIAVSEDETQQLCNIQADAVSDLPAQDQTATAGFIFVRGSKAEVLATSGKYIMNSSGQWILQKSGQEIEISADDIIYDNTESGMTATNVQDAIDEIKDTDDMQDRALAELYGMDANQQLEINYAINTGAKNLFDINTTAFQNHVTSTLADDTLTVTSNGNWAHYSVPINLTAGDYIFTTTISNFSKDSSAGATSVRIRIATSTSGGTSVVLETVTGNGPMTIPFTSPGGQLYVQFYPNYSSTTAYVSTFTANNVMIRDAVIKSTTYEPYAPTNRKLYETKAEQSEVNVIANLGVKNLLMITNHTVGSKTTAQGRTFEVLSDGGIKITGSPDTSYADFYLIGTWSTRDVLIDLSDKNYIISLASSSSLSIEKLYIRAVDRRTGTTASTATARAIPNQQTKFSFPVTTILITIEPSVTIPEEGIIVYPMIRHAEITDSTFEPYAPTNRELYETKVSKEDVFGLGTALTTGLDLNSITDIGTYYAPSTTIAQSLLNCPASYTFRLEVKTTNGTNKYMQTIYEVSTTNGQIAIYRRAYTVNGWQSWYKFEGTQVASVQSVNQVSTLNLNRNDLNEQLDTNFDLIDSIPEEEEGELE